MGPLILGLGTAIPDHIMSQTEATEMAHEIFDVDDRQRRLLNVLYRKSGVKKRHTCLPHRIALSWIDKDEPYPLDQVAVSAEPTLGPTTQERMQFYEDHAFPLACQAVQMALASSDTTPREVTHLVTVSCTGFYSPGLDVQLIQHFGLRPTTQRVHVGFMGCHGVLNALKVSEGLIAANPHACVMLCAVELCSLHYRFQWDPDRFMGNALFADGAGALILGNEPGRQEGSLRKADSWRLSGTGSCLIPDSLDAMSWRIGDFGFEMTLAATVPDLIHEHLRPWIDRWLEQCGTSVEEIGCWAVHPGGPRILAAVEECLSLGKDALGVSRTVLSEMGNMSSPTVLFILERFRSMESKGPCVMLGFGPGLAAEVALFR